MPQAPARYTTLPLIYQKNKNYGQEKTWFITGASRGLGLSLVKKLVREGVNVAATSRQVQDLVAAVGSHGNFLPLAADLTTEESVRAAIEQTVSRFGQIDVVVNNAGYGLSGSLEELSDREARDNFDVNVFGSLNVIRQVMPYLREQQAGHILNISSIGGFTAAFAGWGIYCATKFALSGLSEALAEEAKAFGIHVTAVEPGYFRTSFLSSGSMVVPARPLEVYEAVRASQELHQHSINGNQPGDPEKAVDVIVKITAEKNPPVHLFLGQDAYDMAHAKIAAITKDLEDWKQLIVSTGFATEEALAVDKKAIDNVVV